MLEIALVRWHCESISEIGGFADDKCAPPYLSGAMSTSVVTSKKSHEFCDRHSVRHSVEAGSYRRDLYVQIDGLPCNPEVEVG
jgi:hypothetical protein